MPILDTIKKHLPISIAITQILLCGGSFMAGRLSSKTPQITQLNTHADDDYEGTSHNDVNIVQVAGPVKEKVHTVIKRVLVPGPAGQSAQCNEEIDTDSETDSGAVTTTVIDKSAKQESEHSTVDTKLVMASPDNLSLDLTLKDPFTNPQIRVAAGYRLFGKVWVVAGLEPSLHPFGLDWDVGARITY